MAPCPDISFTGHTLRKGENNNEWCYNFGIPNTVSFIAANEAACLSHYVDPVTVPADQGLYPFDCSYGCAPCVYSQNPGLTQRVRLGLCRCLRAATGEDEIVFIYVWVVTLRVEYAEGRNKYGILFIFSLLRELLLGSQSHVRISSLCVCACVPFVL